MSKGLRDLLICSLAGLCFGAPAWAQLEPAPSEAGKCLVVPERQPAYPEDAYFSNSSGVVVVDLEFTQGKAEPKVEVVNATGHSQLKDTVTEYVRAYRLPCAPAGAVTRLRQEFHFFPNEGRKVSQSLPNDPEEAESKKVLACVTHLDPGSKPSFPERARSSGARVILKITFNSADQEPTIEAMGGPDGSFARSASSWARGYRFPCYAGKPMVATQQFSYVIAGEKTYGLKNANLFTFLRGVKDIGKQKKYLDLNQMRCPFELRLQYRQPHMPNAVLEAGDPVPERKLLIEWLRTLQLDLDRAEENLIWGEGMTLTIPCGKIDL